jgi:single-stranded DNA-specific DHH superfamily exonuclease
MAAGITMPESSFEAFKEEFEYEVEDLFLPGGLSIEYDAETQAVDISEAVTQDSLPWGNGCPRPTYRSIFKVACGFPMGSQHMSYTLTNTDMELDATAFFIEDGRSWIGSLVDTVYEVGMKNGSLQANILGMHAL